MIIRRAIAVALAAILCGASLLTFTASAAATPAPVATWHTPGQGFGPRTAPTNPGPKVGTRITEDTPGWDCRTMGNRICGTVQPCRIAWYSADTRRVCSALWLTPAHTVTGEDWETYTPAGPALVRECQAEHKRDGTIRECFRAWLV